LFLFFPPLRQNRLAFSRRPPLGSRISRALGHFFFSPCHDESLALPGRFFCGGFGFPSARRPFFSSSFLRGEKKTFPAHITSAPFFSACLRPPGLHFLFFSGAQYRQKLLPREDCSISLPLRPRIGPSMWARLPVFPSSRPKIPCLLDFILLPATSCSLFPIGSARSLQCPFRAAILNPVLCISPLKTFAPPPSLPCCISFPPHPAPASRVSGVFFSSLSLAPPPFLFFPQTYLRPAISYVLDMIFLAPPLGYRDHFEGETHLTFALLISFFFFCSPFDFV